MAINESLFPYLRSEGYVLTSSPDPAYNCIAFAAGVDDEWWASGAVWPDDLFLNDSVAALITVYERHGFSRCSDGNAERGFQKIAIYGRDDDYEHAARQEESGGWKSKLGPDDDIWHPTLKALEGGDYGNVVAFMKRPIIAESCG